MNELLTEEELAFILAKLFDDGRFKMAWTVHATFDFGEKEREALYAKLTRVYEERLREKDDARTKRERTRVRVPAK